MKAEWQVVNAILIPILTYACEAWTLDKEEENKLQAIFDEAIKTIISLPKGTPTTILLHDTGNYPIELTIKNKKILHAKRVDSMKGDALIKDVTTPNSSVWRREINWIAEEFNIRDQMTVCLNQVWKAPPRRNRCQSHGPDWKWKHGKNKRWTLERSQDWYQNSQESNYMGKLNRKQCSAKIMTRASMLPVKKWF